MPDRYLLESSTVDGYLLENGTGVLLNEVTVFTENHSFSGVGTATFSKAFVGVRSFSYSGVGTQGLTRTAAFARSMAYSGVGTSTLTKVAAFLITKTYSGVGTSTVTKVISKLLGYTAVGTLALTKVVQVVRAFGAVGASSLSQVLLAVRSFAYTALGTATFTKDSIFGGPPPDLGDPWFEGKTIYPLPSVAGLIEWVDYLPVRAQASNPGRFDQDGAFPVMQVLSSTTGKVAWADYIPVWVDNSKTLPWSTDAGGFIPFQRVTP